MKRLLAISLLCSIPASASPPTCSDPQAVCHSLLKAKGVFLRGTREQQDAATARCLDTWERRFAAAAGEFKEPRR
jgi:hypothetical protein